MKKIIVKDQTIINMADQLSNNERMMQYWSSLYLKGNVILWKKIKEKYPSAKKAIADGEVLNYDYRDNSIRPKPKIVEVDK